MNSPIKRNKSIPSVSLRPLNLSGGEPKFFGQTYLQSSAFILWCPYILWHSVWTVSNPFHTIENPIFLSEIYSPVFTGLNVVFCFRRTISTMFVRNFAANIILRRDSDIRKNLLVFWAFQTPFGIMIQIILLLYGSCLRKRSAENFVLIWYI